MVEFVIFSRILQNVERGGTRLALRLRLQRWHWKTDKKEDDVDMDGVHRFRSLSRIHFSNYFQILLPRSFHSFRNHRQWVFKVLSSHMIVTIAYWPVLLLRLREIFCVACLVFIPKKRSSPVGNMLLWLGIFTGTGCCGSLYMLEYYARINCPRSNVGT